MQDYRAGSPTGLADGFRFCATGFATSVTLQLDVSLADGHHLCETGFATSVTLQLDVSLARGKRNITSHVVDSPVQLVSAPLCRVREFVSEGGGDIQTGRCIQRAV